MLWHGCYWRFSTSTRIYNIIESDLYTTEIKKDYLKDNFTDYDVLITNFPFCDKRKCFKKAFRSGMFNILVLFNILFYVNVYMCL